MGEREEGGEGREKATLDLIHSSKCIPDILRISAL